MQPTPPENVQRRTDHTRHISAWGQVDPRSFRVAAMQNPQTNHTQSGLYFATIREERGQLYVSVWRQTRNATEEAPGWEKNAYLSMLEKEGVKLDSLPSSWGTTPVAALPPVPSLPPNLPPAASTVTPMSNKDEGTAL